MASATNYIALNTTYIDVSKCYIKLSRYGSVVLATANTLYTKINVPSRTSFGTIPSGYRPRDTTYAIINDADNLHWYALFYHNGYIMANTALPANTSYWFSTCWVI